MRYILFTISLVFVFASCKKKTTSDTTAPNAHVTIEFKNVVAGNPIQKGVINTTNAAGNKYSISLLKYYVSNVTLIKADNTEVALNNHDLIDAFDASYSTVEGVSIPNGTYTSIRFGVGVDSKTNTKAGSGDLDPIHNMVWTWAIGYIFYKHEGKYITPANDTSDLQYHLGKNQAYSMVQLPISLNVSGKNKKLTLAFDVNKMYDSPVIDFHTQPIRHSGSSADSVWINQMQANTGNAFSFVSESE